MSDEPRTEIEKQNSFAVMAYTHLVITTMKMSNLEKDFERTNIHDTILDMKASSDPVTSTLGDLATIGMNDVSLLRRFATLVKDPATPIKDMTIPTGFPFYAHPLSPSEPT